MASKKSMTLIELLISIAILSISVGLMSGVIISVVKAQRKSNLLTIVKRNGDFAMSLMEEYLRTGSGIEIPAGAGAGCSGYDSIKVTPQDGSSITIGRAVSGGNGYVYAGSNSDDEYKLTNDSSTNGVNVDCLGFTLSNTSDVPIISIEMVVSSDASASPIVSEKFQTTVISRAGHRN